MTDDQLVPEGSVCRLREVFEHGAVVAKPALYKGAEAGDTQKPEVRKRNAVELTVMQVADREGARRLVPTLSGLAVADGLAAAFDLSLTN